MHSCPSLLIEEDTNVFNVELPEILLDIIEKTGLLSPSGIDHDLADVLLYVGRQGTGTVMVFVVTFAGIDGDEVMLNASLNTTWHVVVDGGETTGHTYRFVVTVLGTVRTLHFWIIEVNGMHEEAVLGRIAGEEAAQAVLTQRTNGAVAYIVVVGLLCKYLLTGLGDIFFLCHVCSCILSAKLVTNFDICKLFNIYFYYLYTFLHYYIKLLIFRSLIDV